MDEDQLVETQEVPMPVVVWLGNHCCTGIASSCRDNGLGLGLAFDNENGASQVKSSV
jgi:hypothetical protein